MPGLVDYENWLKGELYKVYEKSNQHLLPKETYSQTRDDLKIADQQKNKPSSI